MGVLSKAAPKQFGRVVSALQEFFPLKFAAGWDNVGVLIDNTQSVSDVEGRPYKVFLTNDLSEVVAKEAIEKEVDFIVTYHPTPFGKVNKLSNAAHTSRLLLELIANRIAVYSPHTASDAAPLGVNTWLLRGCFPTLDESTMEICDPDDKDENFGCGRAGKLKEPITMETAIEDVKKFLKIPHVRKAENYEGVQPIKKVAVCAGSGASVFRAMKNRKTIDLVVTGEMSHHDTLEAIHNGVNVILCEHTNTERGWLAQLKTMLEEKVEDIEVVISEVDKDPLTVA